MGWWRTEDGHVLGDDPADIVANRLGALSKELLATRSRALALEELLAQLRMVLVVKRTDLLDRNAPMVDSVVADIEREDGSRTIVEPGTSIDTSVRDRVDEMCAAISQSYVTFLERRPTAEELLASICFVLRSRPETYLAIHDNARILRIRPRTATSSRS